MRLIIFSDVHGNDDALKNMLEIEKPSINDICIYCGDLLGYYYGEENVIQLLQRIPKLYGVRGNHDNYYVMLSENQNKDELINKYGRSYEIRKTEVIDYINSLPESIELELEGKRLFICHGSMEDKLEGRIYPDSDLKETEYDYVFSGHSHYQMYRKVGKTSYINPGSLGQPRDKKGFSYCVITFCNESKDKIEFRNIKFEIDRLQQECRKREGNVTYAYTVLEREKRN